MSCDNGKAIGIDRYHTICYGYIPVLPLSFDYSIGRADFPFAPTHHIIRIQGEVPFDAQGAQFRSMQLFQMHQ